MWAGPKPAVPSIYKEVHGLADLPKIWKYHGTPNSDSPDDVPILDGNRIWYCCVDDSTHIAH